MKEFALEGLYSLQLITKCEIRFNDHPLPLCSKDSISVCNG